MGDCYVSAIYGYAEGGQRLRYAVVRSFPRDAPRQKMYDDPRIHDEYADTLWVRSNDGEMIPVETDGTVYLFDGDDLRTMKVRMSEGTDTVGIQLCKNMDDIWAFFKRFEVTAPPMSKAEDGAN